MPERSRQWYLDRRDAAIAVFARMLTPEVVYADAAKDAMYAAEALADLLAEDRWS